MAPRQITFRSLLVAAALVAGSEVVAATPASAARARDVRELYAYIRAHLGAGRIPAFARKYGMKCTACHFAVPILNPYGQAFKDRGYRMENGADDLRLQDPAYWPVFAWLYKGYQLDVNRLGGQTVQRTGSFLNGDGVFGILGSISNHWSVRLTPTVYENGVSLVDAGWVRYNQAFGTDWVNFRIGAIEPDVLIFAGRDYNMSTPRFWQTYAYTSPGSVSAFSYFGTWPGFEVMGHDLGSLTRYTIQVFNANGAPQAHCVFCDPGVYGRVARRAYLKNPVLNSVQLGGFGSYSTWPVGPDTATLAGQQRYGGDLELWFLSDVLPLRLTAIGLAAQDNRKLFPLGTRDQKWDSGMLQLEYVPILPLVFYGRAQISRNTTQAVVTRPGAYGDQDFQMLGAHYYIDLNSRFAGYLEITYARQLIKETAPTGLNATHHLVWIGTHVIF